MLGNFDKSTPLYTIGTAAKMLNVSVQTLRLYEREGLIIPFKKDSKHRLYSQTDIERIDCIRRAIKDKKYTIPAIQTMYSFIPCWSIVKCTEKDRENCEAFHGDSMPCWSYNHKSNVCEDKECNTCDVYLNYTECNKIGNSIKKLVRES